VTLEHDEPMDHQETFIKVDENCLEVIDNFTMQFDSFLSKLKKSNMNQGDVAGAATMTSKLIFYGTNLSMKENKKSLKQNISIGFYR
jgi:hypothetical protein